MNSIVRLCLTVLVACLVGTITGDDASPPNLSVTRCDDFEVDGHGTADAWKEAEWVTMAKRGAGKLDYSARFKMLYSETGVYVLFDGTDSKVTASMTSDFDDLWNEDVFECFFWTNTDHPIYFEYEISPLGYELPILVPQLNGKFLGWRPWHYEGDKKTRKKVVTFDGEAKSGGNVSGWRAEVFIPYKLLEPLQNVPPKPGTEWKANFYRVDYDDKKTTAWSWAKVGRSFHDIKNFGTLVFE